ncbi:nucleotidyltransferase domain-containing protein [Ravibacter arvi]|uniref:Nucleotidyltransferase domain-containing protein n=1 Tax=Ravibacter arvi TaxID=2051041 RepID=A0ABP8LTQ3_9BACT
MKYGLSENSIKAIHAVLAQNSNIETAVLYGSRAKGNYREGSDIDLALIGDQLDLSQMLRIAAMLDDLMIPYKVDVALLHQINNAELKDHILRRGVVFYRKKE